MHRSAMKNGQLFFEAYGSRFSEGRVLELGSQIINVKGGSLRDLCPRHLVYTGADFVPGDGVDIVLEDPYKLPFDDDSVEIIVSSSVFEHAEMFWLSFLEILRVLKPDGLFYVNSPSNGKFHRYPVDCWRFYPDCGTALVHWAERNGFGPCLLESFISKKGNDEWNDFVAIFLKDAKFETKYRRRILDSKKDFYNGRVFGNEDYLEFRTRTEDQETLGLRRSVANALSRLTGIRIKPR